MHVKRTFLTFAVVLLSQLIYANACSEPDSVSSESWTHHTVLDGDGRYHLYWTPPNDKKGDSEITFKVEVRARGYVGLGLSTNGGMAGADIVTGWVKDGKVFFQDRHAIGEKLPLLDKIQNWKLISGFENDTFTVFIFRRKLDTCDEEEDMVIDDSTMRLIFAYSDEDPPDENPRYHKANRGKKSVMLLQSGNKKNQNIDLSTYLHWDIRSPDIDISSHSTLYWCKIYRSPRISKKHHIVHVKPLIQKGHEQFVHHMLLFECVGGDPSEYENYVDYRGHVCFHPNMPKPMERCEGLALAWAIGGEDLVFPEHVGLPLYADPGSYFKLEIHYDNPQLQSGIDNSGLRIYYTPRLRKFDAGSIGIGATASPLVIIPPGRENYVVAGHSNPKCLGTEFPKKGIKALGVLLHAHLAARKIIARHFRGRKELVPLAEDKNYDFNYQEYRHFRDEVLIKPKDRITVECTYDTSKRKNATLGGLSTLEEMCLALILYYPRINRYASLSNPRLEKINKILKTNFTREPENPYAMLMKMKQTLSRYDWSKINIDKFEEVMRYSKHDTKCYYGNGEKNGVNTSTTYPKNLKAFTRESTCDVSSLMNDHSLTDTSE